MTTVGSGPARGALRLIGGTLRLLIAGPPLAIGVLFTSIAGAIDRGCAAIEGAPRRSVVVGMAVEPNLGLHEYKRAARALYADGFDAAAIAELLGENEPDVAHWVCRPGDEHGDARLMLEARP